MTCVGVGDMPAVNSLPKQQPLPGAERLAAAARAVLAESGHDFERAIALLDERLAGDAEALRALLGDSFRDRARVALAAAAGAATGLRATASYPVPPPSSSPQRAAGRAIAAAAMEELTELGKAMGDCTREELLALAARDRTKARWRELCAAGLAPGQRLRDARTAEEVEALKVAARGANDV